MAVVREHSATFVPSYTNVTTNTLAVVVPVASVPVTLKGDENVIVYELVPDVVIIR